MGTCTYPGIRVRIRGFSPGPRTPRTLRTLNLLIENQFNSSHTTRTYSRLSNTIQLWKYGVSAGIQTVEVRRVGCNITCGSTACRLQYNLWKYSVTARTVGRTVEVRRYNRSLERPARNMPPKRVHHHRVSWHSLIVPPAHTLMCVVVPRRAHTHGKCTESPLMEIRYLEGNRCQQRCRYLKQHLRQRKQTANQKKVSHTHSGVIDSCRQLSTVIVMLAVVTTSRHQLTTSRHHLLHQHQSIL